MPESGDGLDRLVKMGRARERVGLRMWNILGLGTVGLSRVQRGLTELVIFPVAVLWTSKINVDWVEH